MRDDGSLKPNPRTKRGSSFAGMRRARESIYKQAIPVLW